MSIEFECPCCESLLRVPDSRAGMRIDCPCCDQRLQIPFDNPASFAGNGFGPEQRSLGAASNLDDADEDILDGELDSDGVMSVEGLRCRRCGAGNESDDRACRRCGAAMSERDVIGKDFVSILSMSWQLFVVNLGSCMLATLMDLATTILAAVVVMTPAVLFAIMLHRVAAAAAIAGSFLILFIGAVVTMSAMTVGHSRFFLSLVQGKPIRLTDMMRIDSLVGRMAVSSAIFWAGVIGGLVAGILPGVLVYVVLWPYGRLIVDRDLGVSEAFAESYRLTSENFLASFLVFATFALVWIASVSLPVVGQFLSFSFSGVLYTVAYQSFLGGPAPQVSHPFSEIWGRKKLA